MSVNVRQLASRVQPTPDLAPSRTSAQPAPTAPGRSFAEALRQAQQPTPDLHLSAHAEQRIAQRGIPMGPAEQQSMHEALNALHQKGAREALVVRSDATFVVNVPNRTVVTALDASATNQRVFTQIDSAIMI